MSGDKAFVPFVFLSHEAFSLLGVKAKSAYLALAQQELECFKQLLLDQRDELAEDVASTPVARSRA